MGRVETWSCSGRRESQWRSKHTPHHTLMLWLMLGWWHYTGFYGNPETTKRHEPWAKLKHLKGTSTLPWLEIGDFNEIVGLLEKEGGSTRLRQQMDRFIEAINFYGFRDLGY